MGLKDMLGGIGERTLRAVLFVTSKQSKKQIPFPFDEEQGGFPLILPALSHGQLSGLGVDDHTIYALLAGRSGGQTLYGGIAASEKLTLRGTSHGTVGPVDLLHVLLSDAAAAPTASGRFQRHGALLYFHDNTAARRLVQALDQNPSNAQLLIHNGTVFVPVTISGDVTVDNAGAVAIGANKVTDAILRQSAGLSLIGRSANSTGNVADITAANDGEVLRRSGTAIGFGQILANAVAGTVAGDNATAGRLGEAARSMVGYANLPASSTYGNMTSISLTAGDWAVTGKVSIFNGGTVASGVQSAVSLFSGNTTTDHVDGDNVGRAPNIENNLSGDMEIVDYRVNITSTTTVYLKVRATYGGTAPQATGRITARRKR